MLLLMHAATLLHAAPFRIGVLGLAGHRLQPIQQEKMHLYSKKGESFGEE
jgi:hypothetical protein